MGWQWGHQIPYLSIRLPVLLHRWEPDCCFYLPNQYEEAFRRLQKPGYGYRILPLSLCTTLPARGESPADGLPWIRLYPYIRYASGRDRLATRLWYLSHNGQSGYVYGSLPISVPVRRLSGHVPWKTGYNLSTQDCRRGHKRCANEILHRSPGRHHVPQYSVVGRHWRNHCSIRFDLGLALSDRTGYRRKLKILC